MIRPFRLLPALALAAVPSSLFLFATMAVDSELDERTLGMMATAPVISVITWILGPALLAASTSWPSGARRADFLLLGAGLAFILPLATILVSVYVVPWLIPDIGVQPASEVPLGLSLAAGLMEIPFGCVGGWITWRLGFPLERRESPDEAEHTRIVHSLGRRRLILALGLVPLLPIALLVCLLELFALGAYSDIWLAEIWWHLLSWIALAGLPLGILIGLLFVYGRPKRHGRIGRAGCLALGGMVVFLLPPACAIVCIPLSHLFPSVKIVGREIFIGLSGIQTAGLLVIFGTVMIPFGLPGGWLFWRVGVRPAPQPPPMADPAAVFD